MLQLNHEDVAQLLTPAEAIDAVRAGLREQAAGQAQLPPRTTTDYTSGKGWRRLMPVIMNGSGYMGFKAMHSTPKVGVRYWIALYGMDSGELLATIDADWITSHRTSAMVAVATDAVVDDICHVLESGDGRSGLASGQLAEGRMAELWRIVSGQAAGRVADTQLTLFKSVGTALQDLSLAIAIYRRAQERHVGQDAGDFPHIRPFGRQ
ncbi:MAG TPA: hypothetical protein VF157_10030 [Chloroflexota bacterium]